MRTRRWVLVWNPLSIKPDLNKQKKQAHPIISKFCHLCDKSFFRDIELRSHILSVHEGEGHEMKNGEVCAADLKQDNKRNQSATIRSVGVMMDEAMSEKTDQLLNDVLVDVDMSMHLLLFV